MIRKTSLDDLSSGGSAEGDSLLQSAFWARFKGCFGWKPAAFVYRDHPLLVLSRNFAAGTALSYVPFGPVPAGMNSTSVTADAAGEEQEFSRLLSECAEAVREHLSASTIFLRFDPPWGIEGVNRKPPALGKPLCKAPFDVQPPSTVIIPLDGDDELLLQRMKPKTRYNIRLAERKGVKVRRRGADFLDTWYDLYRETARRDRIAIHDKRYYETLFQLAEDRKSSATAPKIFFLSAEHGETILGGNIVCLYGKTGTYLYGATANQGRNLMPAYALQWEAIRMLRADGAKKYDLFGIPPAGDPGHPMHGLYRFKTGFGGTELHRPGSYDYPFRKLAYRGYRTAESLRKFYFKTVKKRGG